MTFERFMLDNGIRNRDPKGCAPAFGTALSSLRDRAPSGLAGSRFNRLTQGGRNA
jgi:hypothetical protein